MAATRTISVPQLGGMTAGYAIASSSGDSDGTIDPSKPTIVMINGMYMCSSIFSEQFADARLTAAANLVAIEPPGTGATTCATTDHWTFWDAAAMVLQVMERLGVQRAFVMGTSAGGWIAARMALLAPERIQGLLLLGTSMDYESSASRAKGCWDPKSLLSIVADLWSEPDEDFYLDGEGRKIITSMGFHPLNAPEQVASWCRHIDGTYSRLEGQKRAKMCLINLLSRDGLLMRLADIQCPVHWLAGTKDKLYGTMMPQEQSHLFTSSPCAKFTVVSGGGHYLNATNPKETAAAVLAMLAEHNS